MKVTFLGHACFTLEHGASRIVIDPFLTGNPVCPIKEKDLDVQAVLVSHGHGDHLGDAIAISKRCRAPVIACFELAEFCQAQGASAHSMHIGGGHNFDFGRVKLTPAWHGSAIEWQGHTIYGGTPSGFVIQMGGRTVYHAGDTGLFGDMELIGRLHRPDLALLPIGDNYTMGPEDAIEAVKMLQPAAVVPMHYNTFDLIAQDAQQFARRVQSETSARCTVLEPGESVAF